jgi:hypothetical protein
MLFLSRVVATARKKTSNPRVIKIKVDQEINELFSLDII